MRTSRLLGPLLLLAGCQAPATVPAELDEASTGEVPEPSTGSASEGAPPEIPTGCGNGIVEDDEECDLGFANADDGACTSACTQPRCGDGLLAPDEACDEGADNGGATCSEGCTLPGRLRWSTIVAGPDHDWDVGVAVASTADGSAYFVRQMRDGGWRVVVDRYAADGTRSWSTTLPEMPQYNGLAAKLLPAPNDDGVLLVIFADQAGVAGSERIELLHFDPEGVSRRVHVVTTSAAGRPLSGRLARAGDQIVVTARLEVGPGAYETLIVRLDPAGRVLHERRVEQGLSRVVGLADGGFYAYGNARLMAFDADDQLRWSIPSSTFSVVLAADPEGRPVLTRVGPEGEPLLQAFDAEGELRWEQAIDLEPAAMAVGPEGVIVIAGEGIPGPTELSSDTAIAVQAFDAEGFPRWLELVQGPGNGSDSASDLVIASDAAIWVAGRVSVPFEERDVWFGRFAQEVQ